MRDPSEVDEQREPHQPSLKEILRLTEVWSERLDFLEHSAAVQHVEYGELPLELLLPDAERTLAAEIHLIPPRLELRVRRDQVHARRLRLRSGREQNRRGRDNAGALAIREHRRRHRPVHTERWILGGVAVALACKAHEHTAHLDTPRERIVA